MGKTNLKELAPDKLLEAALELESENKELQSNKKDLEKQLETAAAEYAELSRKLDRAESGTGPKIFGEVVLDKVKYDIMRPKTIYKGRTITADEIAKDKDLAAALVKIGAGILREQPKK